MVAPLRAVLDLSQLHMRIMRRVADNLHERIRQNVLRAGAGNQVAAGLDHLHCAQVDFLVPPRRRFDGAARLGERGRVENHHVVLDACAALLRQQVKRICFDEVDDVL